MKLTKKSIADLKPRTSQFDVSDDDFPGLRLRINKNGSKSWAVLATVAGQRHRVTLGSYPGLDIKGARDRAAKAIQDLKDGIDINAQKRHDRDLATVSLEDAIDSYQSLKLVKLRSGHKTDGILRNGFAGLLSKPVASISRSDISRIADQKSLTAPVMANRFISCASAFFKWCLSRGLVDQNPAIGIQRPSKEKPRDRFLDLDELRSVWNAIGELDGAYPDFFRMLFLTACRKNEVAKMHSSEVDLEDATWTIPADRSKNGVAHTVPLPRHAVEICRRAGSGFVFTRDGVNPIDNTRHGKADLDRASGVHDWNVHDIRRTVVTHMIDLGIDPMVADRLLNHTASATTSVVMRTYQRHQLMPQRREALAKWETFLRGLEDRPDNVVSITA